MARGSLCLQWIPWGLEWSRDTAGLGHMARSGYMLLSGAVRNVDADRGALIARLPTLAMHMRMTEEEAAAALAELAQTQSVDGACLVAVAARGADGWAELDPFEIEGAIADRSRQLKVVVAWVKEAEETEHKWRAAEVERVAKYRQKATRKNKYARGQTCKNMDVRVITRNYAELPSGGEGIGEDIVSPHTPRGGCVDVSSFDAFWKLCPRKVAKAAAEKAYARALREGATPGEIMAGLEKARSSDQWTRDGGRYVPHPATWLNGRRWEDEAPAADDVQGSGEQKNAAAYDWPPQGMMYE